MKALKETAVVLCHNTAIALRAVLPMLVVTAAMFILNGGYVYAQEEPTPALTVTQVVSSSDFTAAITTLSTNVGVVVKAALGLSIGLFLAFFIYKVFRRFVK